MADKMVTNSDEMFFVHASNVTGLGAVQVVRSIIVELCKNSNDILFALPSTGALAEVHTGLNKSMYITRILPKPFSRLIECLFPSLYYPKSVKTIVLGDIPLRGFGGQVVLVHQSNLIKPDINPYSSNSLSFKVMRFLFGLNIKYMKYVVVQSEVMSCQMVESYPELVDKIVVISQPPPKGFINKIKLKERAGYDNNLSLFYPAAGYPHKNHELIAQLDREKGVADDVKEFIITLNDGKKLNEYKGVTKINNVGRLSPKECISYYAKVDALFFPSVAESYGLPLVEAMMAGLPIICSDLPYARWMCEDEAIYFDPNDVESAARAIHLARVQLESGWKPDWGKALKKLPSSWDDVADQFLCLLK